MSLITTNDDAEPEDRDVALERQRVYQRTFPPNSPITITDLRKIYPGRAGYGSTHTMGLGLRAL